MSGKLQAQNKILYRKLYFCFVVRHFVTLTITVQYKFIHIVIYSIRRFLAVRLNVFRSVGGSSKSRAHVFKSAPEPYHFIGNDENRIYMLTF